MRAVAPELRLSAQRALLGAIHPEIRLVKVKFEGRTIVVTTISGEPLGDVSMQAISGAATEIISDFPGYQLEERWLVNASDLPKEDLLEEGWVYLRAEP